MASRCHLVAIVIGTFLVNEASSAPLEKHMKVLSKVEIMAQMTEESALKTVLGMNLTRTKPELESFISTVFHSASGRGLEGKHDSQLQIRLRGAEAKHENLAAPTGYSALEKATEMLNSMMEETQKGLEAEEFRCEEYDKSTLRQLGEIRDGVRDFNGQAAEARGEVVRAQGEIGTATTNLVSTTENFERLKRECKDDLFELNAQLKIVLADIDVMDIILGLIDCGDKLFLVQCRHCNNAIMIQHGPIQNMLSKLQSQIARQYIQNTIAETYHGSSGKSFAQVANAPPGGVNTSDVPTAVQPFDCQPTNKCSLASSPNCMKLKNKFLNVQSGIEDKRDELEEEIGAKQSFCNEQNIMYTSQIKSLNTKLSDERANLATGTENQNQAETGSYQKSAQHQETSAEYSNNMQECCTNQNNAKSEICALKKIRGELEKLEGQKTFIVDCDVSEWQEEECSMTCGGGVMQKKRGVITQPEGGGAACPPMAASVPCNEDPCPVDCVANEWSGWSACSAECGGGVIERSRTVKVEAAHGGEPCEALEEENACNIQSCDVDCELSEWSTWSGCSKACNGGTQRKMRTIATEKQADGKCWGPQSKKRLRFKDCNTFSCQTLLPEGRDTLYCNSKVDIVIVMDGSASLGAEGWSNSTALASKLVAALNGSAQVAFELFSGPDNRDSYKKCVGKKSNFGNGELASTTPEPVDMEKDCGIHWVSHFTSDVEKLSEDVSHENLDWPEATTLTSVALGQAEAELIQGREDANSVVIVITDGYPQSPKRTKAAAKKLQEKAKVIWVPVGNSAPYDLIAKWASQPAQDHIVNVLDFEDMPKPKTINDIITSACPIVA